MTGRAFHIRVIEKEHEKERRQLVARYRLLFEGFTGRSVLADILRDMGVGQDIDPRDPAANSLRNYAETALASKVGTENYTAALKIVLADASEDDEGGII